MEFNINDYVKVKLTDLGKEILRNQHKILYKKLPKECYAEYQEPKEDENGYSKWQLWGLMSHFGNILYNGCKLPFETDIIICNKED